MFETVQQVGLVPDVITYNAVISVYAKSDRPERAIEVFEAMHEQGLVPNKLA